MVRVTKLELHRTISDIMKKGDLDQLTTKKIRMLCEQKYNIDLTSRKQEIDKIVMAFVSKKSGNYQKVGKSGKNPSSDEESAEEESCSSESDSCSDPECSYSESSGEERKKNPENQVQSAPKSVPKKVVKQVITAAPKKRVNPQPSKAAAAAANVQPKKMKKDDATKKAELDDAAYARQLQAEEWNFRQRTVNKLFRNTPQKKNDKNEQTKKKKACPFLKKCLLSPALAEVIGTNEMSRPDIVQKMWSVVRERNLFDTSNKQYALCDEQLTKIFGKKRIRLIGMMKYLKHHIKDIH